MQNIFELILEILPYIISIAAALKAFAKGKKPLTAEQIEEKAEAKKQKLIQKLEKKNHVNKPTENSKEVVADYIKIEEEVVY